MSMSTHYKGAAQEFVRAHCLGALPKNVMKYSVSTYAGEKQNCVALGLQGDHADIENEKVVFVTEDWLVILVGRAKFSLIAREYVAGALPEVGDRVNVTFPKTRRFDGKRVNGDDDPPRIEDGFIIRRHAICAEPRFPAALQTDKNSDFGAENQQTSTEPITQVTSRPLIALLHWVERVRAPSGRRLISVLIAAYQGELAFNSPGNDTFDKNDTSSWLSYSMRVTTRQGETVKLTHRVDCSTGLHEVELVGAAQRHIHSHLYVDELVPTLVHHLDDETWSQVRVDVVKRAAITKAA
jgi:hypothetical protein